MDEIWERAVDTALDGQTNCGSVRALTLDGAVKCVQGRLPPPSLLEKFHNLEHLSIANVGVSSLENFPHLPKLQKLILSDNRISGGLEFLVEAGLGSLRDLDLSNNRIQCLEELVPLAQLKLVSLDLYECSVTRIKDYRSRVFGLIRSLKYLDKMDADENERPESDEEEEDDEEDEEDDDDPGSGEVDGNDRLGKLSNGGCDGIHDVDEDEESDADEEIETARVANGSHGGTHHLSNGSRMVASDGDEDEENVEDEDDDDLGEEIDEEESGDEDVAEVHEVEDSDCEEDGIEDGEGDEDEEEEEVEDEEENAEVRSTVRLMGTEGDIDGHEQGEEDENGEVGEDEEQGIEEERECDEDDGDDEDDDYGMGFLVQPIRQAEEAGGSDLDMGIEGDDVDEEVKDEEDDRHGKVELGPSSSRPKRKRRDDDESVVDAKTAKFP